MLQRAGPAGICNCRTRGRVLEKRARIAWPAGLKHRLGRPALGTVKMDEVKGSGTESVSVLPVVVTVREAHVPEQGESYLPVRSGKDGGRCLSWSWQDESA